MNTALRQLSQELLTRPIQGADLQLLKSHSQKIRVGASAAIQFKDAQGIIIDRTVREIYKKYPDKLNQYRDCEAKTARDMHLVIGYCVYSLLLDDPDYAKERMLYWFRTVLKNYEFGDSFIADCYTILKSHIAKYLEEQEAVMMNHMVDESIAIFVS
ncbi:MAG: hypothetical protein SFY68_12545 [Candidatus Sumerlaeia bacterium]|nr:hypothetical protein [Candidatus Sumerlaeia bacterium]